jgi:GT2 family glycosyltransferase/precorrin-6B methylase 2
MNNTEILANIQNMIHKAQWIEAQKLIDEYRKFENCALYGDILEIFQATIYNNMKEYEKAENAICNGLKINIANYELYFILGNIKEIYGNMAQALFAYENAVFYCHNEDKEFLEEYLLNYKAANQEILPGKVAIIIVSCNNLEYLKLCADSIRNNNRMNSYELIVINQSSDDGTKEWLLTQTDIKYILKEEKVSLSKAYNQALQLAGTNSDIFILNAGSVIMPNTIFNMRMGLYEDKRIGAVGPVSNHFMTQKIEEQFSNIEEYMRYSNNNNVYDVKRHELRIRLMNFAMIYKRTLLNQVGIFDENLEFGNYEADDIGLRFIQSGCKLLVCFDSFLYSFGQPDYDTQKDGQAQEYLKRMKSNKEYFVEKWRINLNDDSNNREDMLGIINRGKKEAFNVLEIGCGCGALLLKLKSRFWAANVFGVELNNEAASIGASILNIEQGNIEDMDINYSKNFFDYIILGDLLEHMQESWKILTYLREFLKEDGVILANIHNLQHHSVILPLLRDNFTYQNTEFLTRNHLKFFTKNEIIKLFSNCNYKILDLYAKTEPIDESTAKFIEQLCSMDKKIAEDSLQVSEYLVEAAKS